LDFTSNSSVIDDTPPQLVACSVLGSVTNLTESVWAVNCSDNISGVYIVTFALSRQVGSSTGRLRLN